MSTILSLIVDLPTSSAENPLYKQEAEHLHAHCVRLQLYLKRRGYYEHSLTNTRYRPFLIPEFYSRERG